MTKGVAAMKAVAKIFLLLSLISFCYAGDNFILEFGAGACSRYMPYSSKWEGRIGAGALDYRDWAIKLTHDDWEPIDFSVSVGYLNDRYIADVVYINPYDQSVFGNG